MKSVLYKRDEVCFMSVIVCRCVCIQICMYLDMYFTVEKIQEFVVQQVRHVMLQLLWSQALL